MALNNVKGLHVAPGIYQKETEIISSNTRTSITTLGLVGETLKGPAFSPIYIQNWREYNETFGGTSTELYKGSKYPRYELPYIANDYLGESNQLIVTRVLGLSGYHAGKAWLIKSIGSGKGSNMLVGVLRSRGHYVQTFGSPQFSNQPVKSGDIERYVQYIVGRVDQTANNPIPNTDRVIYDGKSYTFGTKFFGTDKTTYSVTGSNLIVYGYCGTNYEYDKLLWDAEDVFIGPSGQASTKFTCGKSGIWQNAQFTGIPSTPSDLGTFKLIIKLRETGEYVEYTVSLNPGQKNYIYNVLGGNPDEGNAPIWVEELYDIAFQQLVYQNGINPRDYIEGIVLNSTNGSIDNIVVTDGGFGYTRPIITITDPTGFGATAFATVNPGGEIDNIDIINGGIGYTHPTVVFTDPYGIGAAATATLDPSGNGIIVALNMLTPGSGYTNPTVTIVDEHISSITLTNGGIGYTRPTVMITDPTGTGVSAEAVIDGLSGTISEISVVTPGSGYTHPAVTITDGGTGSGATASAILGGPITAINVIRRGLGYTSGNTSVVITDETGSGATASAILGNPIIALSLPSGTNFTNPTITFSDVSGGGNGAMANAIVQGGIVTSIVITRPGSGYSSSTVVTISDPVATTETLIATYDTSVTQISSVNVTNGGTGYINPVVRIVDNNIPTTVTQSAVVSSTLGSASVIAKIVVNNPGVNYTSPSVTITDAGAGTGATANATVAIGKIVAINVTNNGGVGYTNPTIMINDLTGSGAAAFATISGTGATASATARPTGVIESIELSNTGVGYTNPIIEISDEPVITKIDVVTGGLGYVSPTISISDPTGNGATAIAQIDGAGRIVNITVGNPGTNYTNPTIVIQDQFGTGATAIATVSGGSGALAYANIDMKRIRVIDGGYGYPTIRITDSAVPATGYGAIAILQIDENGILPNAIITNGGTGYTSPIATINSMAGSGAIGVVTMDGAGVITGITISGGSTANGYSAVSINDSTGSGATAIATIDASGAINSVEITNSGSGYTSPIVSFGSNTTAKAEFLYNGLVEKGEFELIISKFRPVNSILDMPNQSLTRSNLNERYLYSYNESIQTNYIEEIVVVVTSPRYSKTVTNIGKTLGPNDDGKILVVKETIDSSGRRTYNYHYIITSTSNGSTTSVEEERLLNKGFVGGYSPKYVFVNNQNLFYEIETFVPTISYPFNHIVQRVVGDISDYKEQFRFASTPWVVSEMIGTFANNEVKRLFRFHTISDGDTANTLFKVSIINIDPANLMFDVVIRDFNDSDASIRVLETFRRCNLNPSSSNYILNKIGDFNNSTGQVSKYVTVEVSEDETIRHRIPCGFLGIPVRDLGVGFQKPQLAYNTAYYTEVKERRQYFGYSDILGIDVDCLNYKGRTTYTDGMYTDGFHLDSRVNDCTTLVDGINPGVNCLSNNSEDHIKGTYTWQTPSVDTLGLGGESPQITSSEDVVGTIYENGQMRKFTVCFYGGFDGWDPYRTSRTTRDDFKYSRYLGKINPNTGEGEHFDVIRDDVWGFGQTAITSDFYAFWAGYLTMGNPSETPINVFATPGIDYLNDTLLAKEAIEIVEADTNQRTIYIITTPDKPFGADDTVNSMFTSSDAVANLDGVDIDSSYTATYYPWMRYFDQNENKTIFLPATRDIIRSIAQIDARSYAWFPPSGDPAGRINCLSARTNLKIYDEDALYGGRINPVKTFARDGVFAWGQKNMKISYENDREPLTRIGVRRMMIRIKSLVERANRGLIFTPNDATTKNKFISNTSAILNDVRSNRGITDYRIEVDDSVEAREARTLPAKIWIKPINMLEYIEIEWVITSQGVELSNLT
jgi:hypothetical protein